MSANELLERYVAMWNEPDATVRRAAVTDLWAPDGLHFTRTRRFRGTEELVGRVTEAHDQFVGGQGLLFRTGGAPVDHDGALAFNWVMTPKDRGDTVLAIGFDVVLLDDGGRIAADYQFNEPPASSADLDGQAGRYLATTTAEPAHREKDVAELYLPGARLVDESGVHEGRTPSPRRSRPVAPGTWGKRLGAARRPPLPVARRRGRAGRRLPAPRREGPGPRAPPLHRSGTALGVIPGPRSLRVPQAGRGRVADAVTHVILRDPDRSCARCPDRCRVTR